jgi:6-phosphogluconolactonase
MLNHPEILHSFDERRNIIIPGDDKQTITFCVEHIIMAYHESVSMHGLFSIALSGGSTPKAVFTELTSEKNKDRIDWNKVHIFWSDERSVGPEHPDSNYHMAMEHGFQKIAIPKNHIHRMQAEFAIKDNAKNYEEIIKDTLQNRPFDYVILGMGDDGHTASLFPHTAALQEESHLVVANYVPQKNTWRMTFTYPCINSARHIVFYVIGSNKKDKLLDVLTSKKDFIEYPSIKIGTKEHKALWIADKNAAEEIIKVIK